ncbi:MAG: hypothetical protein QM504_09905 [Pseudomonadota bacterium]
MNSLLFLSLFSSSLYAQQVTMMVTASAYNSVPSQTTAKNPALTAWGDTLKPGMKAIAVSRDLIKLGLTHKTKVKIGALEGTYLVMDKMNKRWSKKIDIYMGLDIKLAREWGKRRVTISWDKK